MKKNEGNQEVINMNENSIERENIIEKQNFGKLKG